MMILLYGPDSYRSRQKLDEAISRYREVHKKGLSFIIFDCDVSDFSDFRNETGTVSMFGDKKLIIVRNAFACPGFKEEFIKNSARFVGSKDIILFYEDGKIATNDSLLKFLKKEAKCQEFDDLSIKELRVWVQREFEKYKIGISVQALEEILISCSNDLWRLANDIKKIAAFKLGDKAEITSADFGKLLKIETENDIFKTIEAVSSKNKKSALKLLHSHLNDGEAPQYILSMINYQFRTILLVKELLEKGVQYGLLASKTKLHPFAIGKAYNLAKKFNLSEIKKIYRNIFKADLDMKTGKVEPETALDLLISGI